jgi:hypothetical protein
LARLRPSTLERASQIFTHRPDPDEDEDLVLIPVTTAAVVFAIRWGAPIAERVHDVLVSTLERRYGPAGARLILNGTHLVSWGGFFIGQRLGRFIYLPYEIVAPLLALPIEIYWLANSLIEPYRFGEGYQRLTFGRTPPPEAFPASLAEWRAYIVERYPSLRQPLLYRGELTDILVDAPEALVEWELPILDVEFSVRPRALPAPPPREPLRITHLLGPEDTHSSRLFQFDEFGRRIRFPLSPLQIRENAEAAADLRRRRHAAQYRARFRPVPNYDPIPPHPDVFPSGLPGPVERARMIPPPAGLTVEEQAELGAQLRSLVERVRALLAATGDDAAAALIRRTVVAEQAAVYRALNSAAAAQLTELWGPGMTPEQLLAARAHGQGFEFVRRLADVVRNQPVATTLRQFRNSILAGLRPNGALREAGLAVLRSLAATGIVSGVVVVEVVGGRVVVPVARATLLAAANPFVGAIADVLLSPSELNAGEDEILRRRRRSVRENFVADRTAQQVRDRRFVLQEFFINRPWTDDGVILGSLLNLLTPIDNALTGSVEARVESFMRVNNEVAAFRAAAGQEYDALNSESYERTSFGFAAAYAAELAAEQLRQDLADEAASQTLQQQAGATAVRPLEPVVTLPLFASLAQTPDQGEAEMTMFRGTILFNSPNGGAPVGWSESIESTLTSETMLSFQAKMQGYLAYRMALSQGADSVGCLNPLTPVGVRHEDQLVNRDAITIPVLPFGQPSQQGAWQCPPSYSPGASGAPLNNQNLELQLGPRFTIWSGAPQQKVSIMFHGLPVYAYNVGGSSLSVPSQQLPQRLGIPNSSWMAKFQALMTYCVQQGLGYRYITAAWNNTNNTPGSFCAPDAWWYNPSLEMVELQWLQTRAPIPASNPQAYYLPIPVPRPSPLPTPNFGDPSPYFPAAVQNQAYASWPSLGAKCRLQIRQWKSFRVLQGRSAAQVVTPFTQMIAPNPYTTTVGPFAFALRIIHKIRQPQDATVPEVSPISWASWFVGQANFNPPVTPTTNYQQNLSINVPIPTLTNSYQFDFIEAKKLGKPSDLERGRQANRPT